MVIIVIYETLNIGLSCVMLNSFNERTKAGGGSILKYKVKVLKTQYKHHGRIHSMDR